MTTAPLPVLLSADEQSDLLRVLAHVQRFDPGGFAHTARHLIASLDDPERTGEPSYTYVLAGPWGTQREGDGSLETTIAGCRDARAQHWAEGYGRDERYTQIQVVRYTYIPTDFGRFHSAGEVVEVPDFPLTVDEVAENERRLEAAAQRHEALNAYILDGIARGDSDIRVPQP